MKTSKALWMPMLAVLVGVAMIVAAAGLVSNVAERNNDVVPKPTPLEVSILGTTEVPVALGGDRPDWENGTIYLDEVFDAKVYIYADGPASGVSLIVQINKVGINATDVTVQWSDGVAAWANVVWTDIGDSINGLIRTGMSFSTGDDSRYFILVSFHVAGSYASEIFAEGTVG